MLPSLASLFAGLAARRRTVFAFVGAAVVALAGLGWYWSLPPAAIDPRQAALERLGGDERRLVPGAVTTATLARVAETLLDKPGGYLSNDVTPPSLFMDDMPNWEFGVLTQVRDMAKVLRNDFSRAQSQSREDPDLQEAEPRFSSPNDSWLIPRTEDEYRKGIAHVDAYLARLTDAREENAQFYARADNLREWLKLVSDRLGALGKRLAESVGETYLDDPQAGDPAARQSTPARAERVERTPWLELDDVYHEARGSLWAIIAFMRAMEIDFEPVLRNKGALVSLRQIRLQLEGTQRMVLSPIILNGSGFGLLANHSLTMASHVARANAAVIDLRLLLEKG